jgi:hypothetical protein
MAMIENLAVLPRPRTAWQAMDAGFSLARAHFSILVMLWLGLSLPMFALFNLLLPTHPHWAAVLWWWFKPLYELPVLLYLSRALFSDRPGLRETWRGVRQHTWRLFRTYLSLARLSPARSMTAGVVFLEKLPRTDRHSRVSVLTAVPTRAYLLMVVCLHVEALLAYASVALLFAMAPALATETDWLAILLGDVDEPGWFSIASTAIVLIGSMLVAPFYVAGGFLVYINRRMQLEGWDLEHRFRAIRRDRRQPGTSRLAATGSALLPTIVIVFSLFGAQPVQAQTGVDLPSRADVRAQIEAIQAGDEFGRTETRRVPRFKNDNDNEEEAVEIAEADLSWLSTLLASTARLFEVALWIAAGVIALVVIAAIRRYFPSLLPGRLDNLPERFIPLATKHPLTADLPTDIPAAARSRMADGDNRGALSLLYRGALQALMVQHQLAVPASATEDDCLRLMELQATAQQQLRLKELIVHWQQLAYAHELQNDAVVIHLIDDWSPAFAASMPAFNEEAG